MAKSSAGWTSKVILVFLLAIAARAQQPPAPVSAPGTTPDGLCLEDQLAVLSIRVLVYDQAGLPGDTLKEAQRLARLAFYDAGLDLLWLDGQMTEVSGSDCVLLIHCCFDKLKSGLPRGTAGFAPAGGRHIMVFWDRIRTEAAAGSQPEALILGYVLAHEIGHLFLPPGYHSRHGIMKARLNHDDWSLLRCVRGLLFSKEEAGQMRAAVIGRSSAQGSPDHHPSTLRPLEYQDMPD